MKVRANSLELEVEVLGEGTPLLLIMGIGAQLHLWPDSLCQLLVERGFQVIRYDHRDIGRSTWLDHLPVPDVRKGLARRAVGLPVHADYSLSDMAQDAAGLLSALGHDAAHVAGASMGGMISQHLAIEHPERVLSLTSIMSTPGGRRHVLGTRPKALKALLAGPSPTTPDEAVERMRTLVEAIGGTEPRDLTELDRVARLCFPHTHPKGFLRHFAAILASGDRTDRLQHITTPTLVVHGQLDPLIPLSAGRATAEAIPGARLEVRPTMGHDLPRSMHPWLADQIARLA